MSNAHLTPSPKPMTTSMTMTLAAAAPEQSPGSIATNAILPIGHAPISTALETTEIPVVAAGDDAAGLGMNPFAALMPSKARAKQPAANDDLAEPEVDAPVRGGDANARMRRAMAPRLVKARTISGLSQGEAARLLGYKNSSQLNLWEQARRLMPTAEIVRVADVLNVSVDYLVGAVGEPERDPAAGLRNAMLRGVRSQLSRCAEVVVDEVARHARLVGTDSGSTSQFITVGCDLLDAVRGLERLNPGRMDDMRGGATLARRLHEFEAALIEAKRRQRLSQALDAALRERLGCLPDGDLDLGDDLVGDDHA